MTLVDKISKSVIIDQIYSDSNKVSIHFDKFNKDFIETICEEIALQFNSLDGLLKSEDIVLDDQQQQAVLILWTCLSSCIAALELLRKGYFLEPSSICRNTLEYACAALEICKESSQYKKYIENKGYSSTKSPSYAKKYLPMVGQVYGMLSNSTTHLSPLHSLPQGSKETDGSRTFWIGGGFDEKEQKGLHLAKMDILWVLMMIGAIIELCFFDTLEQCRYIVRNTEGDLIWQPSSLIRPKFDPFIEESMDYLKPQDLP